MMVRDQEATCARTNFYPTSKVGDEMGLHSHPVTTTASIPIHSTLAPSEEQYLSLSQISPPIRPSKSSIRRNPSKKRRAAASTTTQLVLSLATTSHPPIVSTTPLNALGTAEAHNQDSIGSGSPASQLSRGVCARNGGRPLLGPPREGLRAQALKRGRTRQDQGVTWKCFLWAGKHFRSGGRRRIRASL